MQREKNLRGRHGVVVFDERACLVTIITHTRHDRWLVTGPELPKRFERDSGCRRTVVPRDEIHLLELEQR